MRATTIYGNTIFPFANGLHRLVLLSVVIGAVLIPSQIRARCIVENEALIKEKAAVKIEEMCAELKEKIGVSFVVSALRALPDGQTISDHEKTLSHSLSEPWVVFGVSSGDKKVDLIYSPEIESMIDENTVLDSYVIPILNKKDSEITEDTRFSAAIFNGSVKIIGDIAGSKSVTMTSVPMEAGDAKSSDFWNTALRMIPVIAFILITAYFIMKHKRQAGA